MQNTFLTLVLLDAALQVHAAEPVGIAITWFVEHVALDAINKGFKDE